MRLLVIAACILRTTSRSRRMPRLLQVGVSSETRRCSAAISSRRRTACLSFRDVRTSRETCRTTSRSFRSELTCSVAQVRSAVVAWLATRIIASLGEQHCSRLQARKLSSSHFDAHSAASKCHRVSWMLDAENAASSRRFPIIVTMSTCVSTIPRKCSKACEAPSAVSPATMTRSISSANRDGLDLRHAALENRKISGPLMLGGPPEQRPPQVQLRWRQSVRSDGRYDGRARQDPAPLRPGLPTGRIQGCGTPLTQMRDRH